MSDSGCTYLAAIGRQTQVRASAAERSRGDPPSGRWIIDGPDEQQRAAAPVFDRTEKWPVDDHPKRLHRARDGGGPYTCRRNGRGF